MAYEKITVVGNIGSFELLTSAANNPYVRMSVAIDRINGENKNTVWYSVLLFGAMVRDPERMQARYAKGRLVLIEGRPQVEAFIRRDGSAGLDNTIVATMVPELLDSRTASR